MQEVLGVFVRSKQNFKKGEAFRLGEGRLEERRGER